MGTAISSEAQQAAHVHQRSEGKKVNLKLLKTKSFRSGNVLLYYELMG
jgi:hypothetical protein